MTNSLKTWTLTPGQEYIIQAVQNKLDGIAPHRKPPFLNQYGNVSQKSMEEYTQAQKEKDLIPEWVWLRAGHPFSGARISGAVRATQTCTWKVKVGWSGGRFCQPVFDGFVVHLTQVPQLRRYLIKRWRKELGEATLQALQPHEDLQVQSTG